jgi:hypothetical protein
MARKGSPKAKRETALVLAEQAPELMRELLAPHVKAYCDELLWDMANRTIPMADGDAPNSSHRTAMDLFPRILKAIGASDDLLAALLENLQARDESQLALAMAMYRDASGASLADAERIAVQTIRGIVKAEPWKRDRLRESCFGDRMVEPEAQPALNGHTNGNGRPHVPSQG